MNRRQRRSVNKEAKKEYKIILNKKSRIENRLINLGIENPLGELNEFKSFWLFNRRITGFKVTPTVTYRFKGLLNGLMIRTTIENLYIAWFGYVLKIKNWTIRSKYRPKGAIWKYVFTFRKKVV